MGKGDYDNLPRCDLGFLALGLVFTGLSYLVLSSLRYAGARGRAAGVLYQRRDAR